MLNFFLGAAGMLLVAAAYIAGALTARCLYAKAGQPRYPMTLAEQAQEEDASEDEIARQRKFLREQQRAFHQMQSYSAAQAYRMDDDE